MKRDLVELAHEGTKLLSKNNEEDLTPRELQELAQSFNLKGNNETIGLIATMYAIGYAKGYRAGQSNIKPEEA